MAWQDFPNLQRRLFEAVRCEKQIREYPETGHNPFDQGRTAEAVADLMGWLSERGA